MLTTHTTCVNPRRFIASQQRSTPQYSTTSTRQGYTPRQSRQNANNLTHVSRPLARRPVAATVRVRSVALAECCCRYSLAVAQAAQSAPKKRKRTPLPAQSPPALQTSCAATFQANLGDHRPRTRGCRRVSAAASVARGPLPLPAAPSRAQRVPPRTAHPHLGCQLCQCCCCARQNALVACEAVARAAAACTTAAWVYCANACDHDRECVVENVVAQWQWGALQRLHRRP